MKLPQFFRKETVVPEAKSSPGYALHFTGQQAAAWSGRTYKDFATEGYSQNVVAFQAINRLANAVASLSWQAWKGEKLIPGHPILKLLANPNPLQSGTEFWRAKISYLFLSGNAYDERVVQGSRLLELWTHRPDRMKIIPAPTGLPAAYEYKVNGRTVSYPADAVTGDSDIRHIKLFNPLDDWYGMPPARAGAMAIDQHNEAMSWLQALLQNSARPSGALSVPADSTLSENQFTELKRDIETTYAGSRNAGRPMLLEGGMSWIAMGLSPDDMEIINTKDSAARDISLAFGVPPLLLNIPGDTTYANYREARLGFYEDTVIPLAHYVADEMNSWLAPYMNGAEIRPDIDAIEAVAEKRKGVWDMVDQSDELTVNEARAMKGYAPLDDAKKGSQLLAELRSTSRGHDGKKPKNGVSDVPKPLT